MFMAVHIFLPRANSREGAAKGTIIYEMRGSQLQLQRLVVETPEVAQRMIENARLQNSVPSRKTFSFKSALGRALNFVH